MRRLVAIIISILFLVAVTFTLAGCPSAPEKKPAEPAKKEAAAPAPGAPGAPAPAPGAPAPAPAPAPTPAPTPAPAAPAHK